MSESNTVALRVTGGETACEEACPTLKKKKIDSATSHRDEEDGVKKFTRQTVAVGNSFWKRRFLQQRRPIRNWQLCPDSIDKV